MQENRKFRERDRRAGMQQRLILLVLFLLHIRQEKNLER